MTPEPSKAEAAAHLRAALASYAATPGLTYSERKQMERLIAAALGLIGEASGEDKRP